jgi:phosphatidylserine decarboxylase
VEFFYEYDDNFFMSQIFVYDREKGKVFEEKVFPLGALQFLYGKKGLISSILRTFVAKLPVVSFLYGAWSRTPWTRFEVKRFIKEHQMEEKEFEKNRFSSFHDFFIRALKKSARPIASSNIVAPADGRYFFYQNFSEQKEIIIKGQTLSLSALLGGDEALASKYSKGSLIAARLAPVDYHRFHFPINGTPRKGKKIRGYLYSVSPIAFRKTLSYITQNKRVICPIETASGKTVLAIAVGATNVGSIHFTYTPNQEYKKGDEMGYFDLGASLVIYLFEPGHIQIDEDLLAQSQKGIEVYCKMGSSLAK